MPFDISGVLYWVGTAGGTRGYVNPHGKADRAVAARSETGQDDPSHCVAHEPFPGNNYAQGMASGEPWISVDLGAARRLTVDHFCFRLDHNGVDGYAPHNWRIETMVRRGRV
jgi:hypothetical protein